jgi:dephospho-CoA kinase
VLRVGLTGGIASGKTAVSDALRARGAVVIDADVLVVVDVDQERQLERLQERNGLDRAAATSRLAAQASREARLAVADVLVDNNATRQDLSRQVDRLWADLRVRATGG